MIGPLNCRCLHGKKLYNNLFCAIFFFCVAVKIINIIKFNAEKGTILILLLIVQILLFGPPHKAELESPKKKKEAFFKKKFVMIFDFSAIKIITQSALTISRKLSIPHYHYDYYYWKVLLIYLYKIYERKIK